MKRKLIFSIISLAFIPALLALGIWASWGSFNKPLGDTIESLPLFKQVGNSYLPRGATRDFAVGSSTATSSAPFSINISGDDANLLASGSLTFRGLVSCDTIDTNASGVLTCGIDATGGGSFSGLLMGEGATTKTHIDSLTYSPSSFNFSPTASVGLLTLDYTNGPASRSLSQTWTGTPYFSVGASFSGTTKVTSLYDSAGNNVITLKSGNVGIGTTSPTTKLDVIGNASVSGDFEVGGRLRGDSSNMLSVADDVYLRTGSGYFFANYQNPEINHYYGYFASQASSSLQLGQSSDSGGYEALLEYSGLTINRTFTLPDQSGTFILSSGSIPFETTGYASASQYFGAALTDCDTAATSKLLWSDTGVFSCGTDQSGGGGGTQIEIGTGQGNGGFLTSSVSFSPSGFNVTDKTGWALVDIDYTNGPASKATANTWAGLQTFTSGFDSTTDFVVSTDGSTVAVPRTGAFNDLSSGEAARFMFGDEHNAFQNGYAQDMNIYSYWGLILTGGMQNYNTSFKPMPFSKTTDVGVLVKSNSNVGADPGDHTGLPIDTFAVMATASQTSWLQTWRDSAGTRLSYVSPDGRFGILAQPDAGIAFEVGGLASISGFTKFGNNVSVSGNFEVTGMTYSNLTGAVTGNASTATALAANGANCNAGEYPLGVNASGAVETCTDATTEINSIVGNYLPLAGGTLTGGLFGTTASLSSKLEVGTGDQFTVLAATGNTTIAGTLNLTGLATMGAITATGVIDFGGATSFEIPNGTNPTVDAEGEIAIDSSGFGQFVYYASGSVHTITDEKFSSFNIPSVSYAQFASASLGYRWRGITIKHIWCKVTSATSVPIKFSTNGTTDMDTLTCTTSGVTDDGNIANSTVNKGTELYLEIGTAIGEADRLIISVVVVPEIE